MEPTLIEPIEDPTPMEPTLIEPIEPIEPIELIEPIPIEDPTPMEPTPIKSTPPPPKISGFPSPSWTIYTKSNCPFCTKVKDLLVNENPTIILCDDYLQSNYTIIQNGQTIKISPFLDYINQFTTKEHKTFPIVFHQGEYIGGYIETLKYYNIQQVSWDL
jgi:glutaredoxin